MKYVLLILFICAAISLVDKVLNTVIGISQNLTSCGCVVSLSPIRYTNTALILLGL